MFRNIETGQLAIGVGVVTAVSWIVFNGTLPLVISIVGGGLIALRASMGEERDE